MDETAIVPYRVEHQTTIEPIDIALVPDCGRSEFARTKALIVKVGDEMREQRSKVFSHHFHQHAKWIAVPPASALLFFLLTMSMVGWWVFYGIGGALAVLVITFFRADTFSYRETDESRQLAQQRTKLSDQLEGITSRAYLTGIAEQAMKIEEDIKVFNSALGKLAGVQCSDKERAKIHERRAGIMKSIETLRSEVLED